MQSPESIWKLAKWARNREGATATTTPALKDPITNTEYIEAQDKARLLKTTFFPTPPEPDLQNINGAEYPDQISFPDITEKEGNSTEEIYNRLAETMQKANIWAKRYISGASATELRKIYQAVIIPQMMYSCSAWSVAQGNKKGYTKQIIDSLKRL
ncbi:reverse transcriptase protein [Rutstroemia sp. NJR-2017a WRK4]|nr:reverse transcriptase protein [Rutstroemia sp. NJR-2017a WRK4]